MAGMVDRMVRASRLEPELYEEVEADSTLNQEALMVVIIVSVAAGIGGLIAGLIAGDAGAAILGLVVGVVLGVVNYYIWAYVTYFVGTNLFNGTATVGEMLRTLGFASAPRILGLLVFIPCVGPLISLVGAIWSLVAGVIAVRQALDFDTGKAVITVIIGWVIIVIITFVVAAIIGVGMAGVGALGGAMGGA